MDQFKKLFASISPKQRFTIVVAVLLVGGGLLALSRWQKEQGFRPLFQALTPEDAAGIVQKLRESGVEFRISESGTSVSVPSDKVAELRLEMAGIGLPKSGRIGFELFDKTTFGATDFTEHVNYGRALEGELERSIMSMNEVENARVHLTFAKESVFVESRQPAKASVLLRLRAGRRVDAQSVLSITHLVSSAVEGLNPDAVSVLDMRGTLLSRPKRAAAADGIEPPDASLEYQQQLERSVVQKINTTLEPLLGADKFRAAASIECDFSSGDQSEETFDPSKSVMVSSQKIEDTTSNGSSAASGGGSTSGVPGTASNLPRPESAPATKKMASSRTSENVTYQTSRVVRHTHLPQGAVKRQSVSVLIDQEVKWEKQGEQMQATPVPPSPEKQKMIRDLVAGVIGLNETRGDQLTIETLPFESSRNAEPPAANPVSGAPGSSANGAIPNPFEKFGVSRNMVMGIGGGALLLLVGGVVFLFTRRKSGAPPVHGALPPGSSEAGGGPMIAGAGAQPISASGQRQLPGAPIEMNTLVSQVRDAARKDADTYAEVLQNWLVEEKAR